MTAAVQQLPAIPISLPQRVQKKPLQETSLKLVKAIQEGNLWKDRSSWKKRFEEILPADLHLVLEEAMQELASSKDPAKAMELLAEVVPFEKLQEAVKKEFSSDVDALKAAKNMVQEAKYYLEKTDEKIKPSLKVRLRAALDAFLNVLESVINAFGIADFFKPSEGDIHSSFKAQKIFMLLTLFSVITPLLLPIVGAAIASAIVGGSLLFISLLSIVFPYLRPVPSAILLGENLTKEIQEGKKKVLSGRKETLDEIANTFRSCQNPKRHPMLIGRQGVGKTETARAFVNAIERGDYPWLKGKVVFYFNTTNIVDHKEIFGGGNKILKQIVDTIGRHKDNVILIFDEIHVACQKKEGVPDICGQLKTLLDPNNEKSLPYFIGITTEEEYNRDIYGPHAAFARRFKVINVDDTDTDETLEILNQSLIKEDPKAIVDNDALPHLLEKTKKVFPKVSQPGISRLILSNCIQLTSETQKSPTEKKIEVVRKKIFSLYSKKAAAQGQDLLPYGAKERQDQIDELEKQLEALVKEFEEEKKELKSLNQVRDGLAYVKVQTMKTVMKVSQLKENALSSKNKKDLSSFLLLSHYLAPQMITWIREESERLKVQAVIDKKLVDEVIEEEQQKRKKVQEAVERGQKELEEREAKKTLKADQRQ